MSDIASLGRSDDDLADETISSPLSVWSIVYDLSRCVSSDSIRRERTSCIMKNIRQLTSSLCLDPSTHQVNQHKSVCLKQTDLLYQPYQLRLRR